MTIHPTQKPQIALILVKKVTVQAKYMDFANIFLKESAELLPGYIEVNKHVIKLKNSK